MELVFPIIMERTSLNSTPAPIHQYCTSFLLFIWNLCHGDKKKQQGKVYLLTTAKHKQHIG